MRLVLFALLIAVGLAPGASRALPMPPDEPIGVVITVTAAAERSGERDLFWETELYCMTLAIYFEGGSTAESEIGQRHIAHVISQRARANRKMWGGPTICGVVFYAASANNVCQFSFACLPLARRTPHKGARWDVSAEIAREELEGVRREAAPAENTGEEGDAAPTSHAEPDPLIRYYMNPALTPLKNVCRFQKEFVPVVKAGRHNFFREPTSEERRMLAQSEPEACKRYAAMLQAQKAKALKAKRAKLAKAKLKSQHAAKAHRKKKHARVARR